MGQSPSAVEGRMPIASRILKLRNPDGDIDIAIRLFRPEPDGEAWRCRYEIDWPEGRRDSAAHGIDAMQALHLALQKIGLDLYRSPRHASSRLAWGEPGEGYGFPVPKNGRDFLISLDKEVKG